jgi:hypothetical protein
VSSKAALARASQLAVRARELRRAQADVQELTLREVDTLARTAASFFDILPHTVFSNALMPVTARGARRVRHRILHRVFEATDRSVVLRVMLLGKDGVLRVFTARASSSADLMASLDPGRLAPTSVLREIEEWTPALRVADFRPLEVLDHLAQSLDVVESVIARAEAKVHVQKDALERGDLGALRQSARTNRAQKPVPDPAPALTAPPPATPEVTVVDAPPPVPARAAGTPARGFFPILPSAPPA